MGKNPVLRNNGVLIKCEHGDFIIVRQSEGIVLKTIRTNGPAIVLPCRCQADLLSTRQLGIH